MNTYSVSRLALALAFGVEYGTRGSARCSLR